jgi:hypothetical protein
MGLDPNLVYLRSTEEVSFNKKSVPFNFRDFPEDLIVPRDEEGNRRVFPVCKYLFFCGKLYTSVDSSDKPFSPSWESQKDFYYKEYFPDEEKYFPRFRYLRIGNAIKVVESLHDTSVSDEIFCFLECPVFLVTLQRDSISVVKNPQLYKLGFQHVVDSYSAYQSIASFLGNNLVSDRQDSYKPSNEEVIHATGHNARVSFRGPNR